MDSRLSRLLLPFLFVGLLAACGDDGSENTPPEPPPTPECGVEGDERSTACGSNGRGAQLERCVDGEWQPQGGCVDEDQCTDGEESQKHCGLNQDGIQPLTCVEGRWVEGECVDDDVCTNDDERTVTCGLNDRGSQHERCVGGSWQIEGECVDPDECVDGSESPSSCGINGGGVLPITCVAGHFVPGECMDDDVCTNDDEDLRACGHNGRGEEPVLCVDGQWMPTAPCVDPDECVDGSTDIVDACHLECHAGTWALDFCEATKVSVGARHACAVLLDGSIACWGQNNEGRLGDGTTSTRLTPVRVVGITNAVDVCAAEAHTCAVLEDGTVECWGSNAQLRLGSATGQPNSPTPVAVPGITDAVQVSCEHDFTCVRHGSGKVSCWGSNAFGQLGRMAGTTAGPGEVDDLDDAVEVSAGSSHACVRHLGGDVSCWGNNRAGQVQGDDGVEQWSGPVPVPAATGAVSVSAGGAHTCAALENGAVLCWGRNTNGQLGLGVSSNTVEMPTPVPGLQDAIAVATAGARTCALLASGEAACWGDDDLGTLGIGVPLDRNAPTPVVSLVDAVQSDAGLYGTCALRANGRLVCWGQNDLLGRGGSNNALTPSEVFGVDDAVMVSAGGAEGPPTESHTCVLQRDGGVRCFGSHQKGQLGDGRDYGNNAIPVDVAIDAVDAISLGARHSCALRAGRVLCWGDDSKGQIGGGGPRRSPVDVGISNVVDVAAGEETTCAVHVDGTVSCWGKEVYSGATQVPTEVSSITDAQAVTVGSAHVCVLHEDGRVSCWGDGTSWQLGNGTMDSSATPVQVQGLEDAIAISAGRVHTCALRETKTVVCWGWGAAGQLGHGATSASGVPVDVVGLTDVVAIGSGEYHTCAALESGEVFCWGRNNGGQIGQGALGGNSGGLPLKVVSLPQDVTALAGGFQHTCAVRANGTTLCWGGSAQGQTGDGRPFTTVPLPVLWPMP